MFYMAAVTLAAALPQPAAAGSALASVLALNFFFVPPRRSLAVGGSEYWWILLSLLALSFGLSAVLGSLRRRREEADAARARASDLHALAQSMADVDGFEGMALAAASRLEVATGRPCAIFAKDETGGLSWFATQGREFHERAAAWAIESGRPLGAGSLAWPELRLWCAPFSRFGSAGAVQVLLGDGERPDSQTTEHWLSLVRQAGLALERERAAAAAMRSERTAQAEAARNTLLASLSHDLRTPLAGIVGSASALRTQAASLSEAQKGKLLEAIEYEARDLAVMADNVLQIARLSQPSSELASQWESIEDVLGAAVARARRRWPTASIQLKAPPGLPPLRAEAGLLAQALANLVDNAARHGGSPAKVVVQAGRSREGVFVAVRDFGAGLPEGDPTELFARWKRGQAGRAGGSGLGLAICQLAAQAHGGAVSAKRCDPGSEFRIDLPVPAAPEDA